MRKKKPAEFVRNNEPTPLKAAINQMFDAYNIRKKVDQESIKSSWEKVMGKTVASRTTKIFFRENKLIVEVNSAALRKELELSTQKVLHLLNQEFGAGAVEGILFI